jgi:Homeodomain-like domain
MFYPLIPSTEDHPGRGIRRQRSRVRASSTSWSCVPGATLVGHGTAPARALTHARILLKANQGEAGPGWTDPAIATAVEVHHTTVARVRQQYAAGGLDAAVNRKAPEREYRRKLDGSRRPAWSRWRAAPHPRAASAGRCGCWHNGWSSWRSWMRSRVSGALLP